jgi:hypothetical protein
MAHDHYNIEMYGIWSGFGLRGGRQLYLIFVYYQVTGILNTHIRTKPFAVQRSA